MHPIKCESCGKFIKESDIPKCKQREKWSWDKTELEDVFYTCLKCRSTLTKSKGDANE